MSIISEFISSRSHPSNPDRWLIRMLGGDETDAGIRVDRDTALSSTAVFAGVRLIAEGLATIPLSVMQRDGESREARPDHPLHRVLHDDWNPELTAPEGRSILVANAVVCGNGYAEVARDNAGRIAEMWPIWPHRIRPARVRGQLGYRVATDDGEVILGADQVLHLRGFSMGGLVGLDVVETMRNSIGLTVATEKYGAGFFAKGMNPSGVLEHPSTLGDVAYANLKESWRGGLDAAHRVKILEEGMSFKPLSVPPEAAQFLETRKFQVVEVARMLNVAPHLLRSMERATFSNIEQQAIEHVVHTLRPWAVLLEKRLNRLLSEADRSRGFYVHHRLDGLLRGDQKSRYEAYAIGRNWGWLSADDVRALEDQNPLPDGQGGTYLVPANMVPADMLEEVFLSEPEPPPAMDDDPPPEPPEGAAERMRELVETRARMRRETRSVDRRLEARDQVRPGLEDRAATLVEEEVRDIREAMERHLGQRDLQTLAGFLTTYYRDLPDRVSTPFRNLLATLAGLVADAVLEELGAEEERAAVEDALADFVSDYTETMGVRWAARSRRALERILEGEDPERVEAELDAQLEEWSANRAATHANEEAARAESALTRIAYLALGVAAMMWRSNGNSCPLCRAMNGRTVAISAPFLTEGDEVEPELQDGEDKRPPLKVRGKITHPPLHRGCDCSLVSSAGI